MSGHLPVVEFLISKGARIDQVDNGGYTPLQAAAWKRHLPVAEYLKRSKIDQANNSGQTPLMVASEEGHLDVVRVLVDANSSLVLCDNVNFNVMIVFETLVPQDGNTAKDIATKKGHLEIAAYLDEAVGHRSTSVVKALNTPTNNSPEPTPTAQTESDVEPEHSSDEGAQLLTTALSMLDVASTEALSHAFGKNLIPNLVQNPNYVAYIQDKNFLNLLLGRQTEVQNVRRSLDDPRMCQVVIFQLGQTAPVNVVEEYLLGTNQPRAILKKFTITIETAMKANHYIFPAKNNQKTGDVLVAKLIEKKGHDFLAKLHTDGNPETLLALQRMVQCEDWGEVQFHKHKCYAVVMNKGMCNCKERLKELPPSDVQQPTVCVFEPNYIGCSSPPQRQVYPWRHQAQNFVYFDPAGFKAIDFEHTKPFEERIERAHFTREYCPPEMAKLYFAPTLKVFASPALDVWSTAVLVLNVFGKRRCSH
ncbi:Aste57867_12014 [Aphanomyces stellatus]|uniref:Aste57867_12014 protein n=1 Tax=Aphanomyces stellatus TaxID=120398 RepID=A0A485KUH9_9STRA|nr:hypothetical protein As57867_011969 [Aphanomyces stellatus]VFT88869.1 Aste57867_12014 [Aphanomyces stellatus]